MEDFVGGRLGFCNLSGAPFDGANSPQHRDDALVIVDRGAQLARPAKRPDGLQGAKDPGVEICLAEQPLQRQLLLGPIRRIGELCQLREAGA